MIKSGGGVGREKGPAAAAEWGRGGDRQEIGNDWKSREVKEPGDDVPV